MGSLPPTWRCSLCTTDHEGEEARFLQCKTCGTSHVVILTDDDSDEQPRRSMRNKKNKLAGGAAGPAAATGASEAGAEVDAPAPSERSAAASLVTLS